MDRKRVIIDGWPVLMSLDVSALYLSVDHSTFLRLALEHCVQAVDVGLESPRWRKADLDRLVRRLPAIPASPSAETIDRRSMSDADIDKLATAVAQRISADESRCAPELFSIKDAGWILGLGRSTIYRLISERSSGGPQYRQADARYEDAIERLQVGLSG